MLELGRAFDLHCTEDGPVVRNRSAIMIKEFYSTMLMCLRRMLIFSCIITNHHPHKSQQFSCPKFRLAFFLQIRIITDVSCAQPTCGLAPRGRVLALRPAPGRAGLRDGRARLLWGERLPPEAPARRTPSPPPPLGRAPRAAPGRRGWRRGNSRGDTPMDQAIDSDETRNPRQ